MPDDDMRKRAKLVSWGRTITSGILFRNVKFRDTYRHPVCRTMILDLYMRYKLQSCEHRNKIESHEARWNFLGI